MNDLAPFRPHLLLVDEAGIVIGERREKTLPTEITFPLSYMEEERNARKREQRDKSYETQITKLKQKGLYGSTQDPMWNPKTRRHECCGAPRSYYHRRGCAITDKKV